MRDAEVRLTLFEELARGFLHRGEPRSRDHCLVLAADAALSAGHAARAEEHRQRLLQVNPHHLLKPFASMVEAMRSRDVQDYVADLRAQWPLDVAERVLREQRGTAGGTTLALYDLAPPTPPAARPVLASGTAPRKPTPAPPPPPPSTEQTASPLATAPLARQRPADQPTPMGRLLANLFFFLGVLLTGAIVGIALVWPLLD